MLTAYGNFPCPDVQSSLILSISRQAVVSAGADLTICQTSGSVVLTLPSAMFTTSISWTSSGTGIFADPTLINPVYTPSAADIISGSVVLTVTGTSTTPCVDASDAMTLFITGQAIANAGLDAIIVKASHHTFWPELQQPILLHLAGAPQAPAHSIILHY
jgi:hypothetical protein